VKKLDSYIINDMAFQKTELPQDALPLTDELWNLIRPHICGLSSTAELYGRSRSGSNESIWLEAFESRFTNVVEKVLHLRTRLRGTNCEHNFTWPSAGEAFDPRTMQTIAGVSPNADPMARRRVAFATFSGLEVTTTTNLGIVSPSMVYKAVVKLYPQSIET
jgi:hypothetical protein